ncbi:MAG TPA: hypothetical protein PL045_01725 [Chitinophagaceae bacterium]|nr:hypothetical protein [Chitinophagaceae bacterium]
MNFLPAILLDAVSPFIILGGFVLFIVLPLAALIVLVVYFIRRNRKKKRETM